MSQTPQPARASLDFEEISEAEVPLRLHASGTPDDVRRVAELLGLTHGVIRSRSGLGPPRTESVENRHGLAGLLGRQWDHARKKGT